MAFLVVCTAVLASAVVVAAPSMRLLHNLTSTKTWFGDAAVAMHGVDEPVLVVSSWVFSAELVAVGVDGTAWDDRNFTKIDTFETLYVATAQAPLPASQVDSVAFFNQKPDGIIGNCSLIGFNSHSAPVPHPSPSDGPGWRTDFDLPCENVNLWVPFSRFGISEDGKVAMGWVQDASGNVTVFGLDGVTGKVKWRHSQGTDPKYQDYFLCYGATLTKDGAWVVYDEGIEGGPGVFTLHVLDAATGVERGVVSSVQAVEGWISPDGAYLVSYADNTRTTVTVVGWDEASKQYKKVGDAVAPTPTAEPQWVLADCSWGQDNTTTRRTILACGFFSSDLQGVVSIAVWDVGALSAGPISLYTSEGVNNGMAFDGLEVECARSLCAVALMSVVASVSETVLVLDGTGAAGAKAAPLFKVVTRGTMNAISVAVGTVGGEVVYYVGAAGCSSIGGCDPPGAEAFLWQVAGV